MASDEVRCGVTGRRATRTELVWSRREQSRWTGMGPTANFRAGSNSNGNSHTSSAGGGLGANAGLKDVWRVWRIAPRRTRASSGVNRPAACCLAAG